ncbi:BtpA/SgcQ family protein [Pseudenhygromyxa sp. WMMC2535]|uniref:BtpA/SgcQ family protein n=1 Tax=Pseudenhygromyxa sp. WMMC2535 TaxID=2712867 RepID=UPI001555C5F8|nr:BtpA/SgcQ family protein [Pseudenhygromyxa sp. WMMC2535]NVB37312.1 BtpA/SgcQ family protein [Pseudenhygromyxa sp. WMMC2535]
MIPRGLIGVVHLPGLPGDPGAGAATFSDAYDHAHADAEALVAGGVAGLIVENFGSAPFVKGCAGDRLPPWQAAALALVTRECRALGVPVGVNCLRNDAHTAMGIAAACELDFIRVNVHSGAYVTDQGVIEGEAAATLRLRRLLGVDERVAILADVLVKHAAPLAPLTPEAATRDCLDRGHADAVIVSGSGTGEPVDAELLERVRKAASGRPVLIGSGLTPGNAPRLRPLAEAAIVGTWLKVGGRVHAPVDPERVKRMVAAWAGD